VEFPSKKEILPVQQSAVDEYERCQQGNAMARQEVPPQQVDAGGMRMMTNAIWIPDSAVELQLRVWVEAHCRSAGHRAYEATLGAIKEYVAWTTMAKDVKVFAANCLLCVATVPGDKVPRSLGAQLQATKPNEILNFDFLYIGLSRCGKYQYLLSLKDDLSGYLWLVLCRTANAAATVDALMRWFAVFGVVLIWISERGSHFKIKVVRRVQKEFKAEHHFTTASCPWSNGTIKSACKQVIRAFRAGLSELKEYADEWPEVVNMVQSVLNNSLSTRLNKRTPMQVFTGNTETTPLALMLKDNVPVNALLEFIKAQKLMEVQKLSKAMTEIHAQVAEKATRDRKATIQKHKDKTHVRSSNFQVADYVIVAEHRKSGASKLQVKWKGPRRVASVESDYMFIVENLLTKALKAAHATHLRFYEDKDRNVKRRNTQIESGDLVYVKTFVIEPGDLLSLSSPRRDPLSSFQTLWIPFYSAQEVEINECRVIESSRLASPRIYCQKCKSALPQLQRLPALTRIPKKIVIERILSHGVYDDGNVVMRVHWFGFGFDDDTWEPITHISSVLSSAMRSGTRWRSHNFSTTKAVFGICSLVCIAVNRERFLLARHCFIP
jgi:Integrase core domain/Integrase zinc binding domain